jgi:hypothetical protein
MATSKTKSTTTSHRNTKGKMAEGFGRVLTNVENVVDTVSFRLWELTR